MDIYDHTPDDEKAKGQWFEYDGARFRIASTGTGTYERAVIRATRKLSQAELKAKPEMMNAVVINALAETVLLNWEGVNAGGKDYPATLENRVHLLTKGREFRDWVTATAGDVANFAREALAEDAEAIKSKSPVEA